MTPPLSGCPKPWLPRCLQDALATVEEEQLAEHLTHCAACRAELERLAGGDREWTQTGTILRQIDGTAGTAITFTGNWASNYNITGLTIRDLGLYCSNACQA